MKPKTNVALPTIFLVSLLTLWIMPVASGADATALLHPSKSASGALTLDDAVGLVLQGNHDLHRLERERKKVEEKAAAVKTRLNPQVRTFILGTHNLSEPQVRVESGLLGELPKLGAFPPTAVTFSETRRDSLYSLVSVSQPLTQCREIRTGVELLKTSGKLAFEKMQQTKLELVAQAKKLICTLSALEQAQVSNQAACELFRELSRTASRLVEEGFAQKFELFDAQARLAAVEARAEALRLQRESVAESFNRLCGRALETLVQVASLPEPLSMPVSMESESDRLTAHPAVRMGEALVTMARLEGKKTRGEQKPQAALTVNHLTGHRTAEYLPDHLTTAGILISWEPFAGKRHRHERREKQIAQDQAEEALINARDTVLQAQRATARRCQEALAALAAAREKQRWAGERARVIKNRLQEKSALLKDVLEAQAHLAEADQQEHQCFLDVWIARADHELALGEQP